ncbi:MAG: tyrosine-type recombinase/integrase [Burkholderiales bacterium]|nr:tyrosine-type recombinase/integrase [Burkholderiales bacterium]
MKFCTLVDGYAATTARPGQSAARLMFWTERLGELELLDITPEHVDAGLVHLAERGKLRPVRGGAPVRTGKPLSPATLTRYGTDLAGVFRFARRQRLVPRTWTSPTKGLEVAQSPLRHDYISADDKDKLVRIARMVDSRWGRMAALIEVAFSSGWRAGNLHDLSWDRVDLESGVITAPTSKSGQPLVTPVSTAALAELRRLPCTHARVFCNRRGGAYHYRDLWERITALAGMKGKVFHMLRHGCASTLAAAGASQAQLMAHMGHASLASSRRYLHADIVNKRALAQRVFG